MGSFAHPSKYLPEPRVLIVEDEALIALALEDILVEIGCRVAGSTNTVAGALAFSEMFDLAILDVHLLDGTVDPVAAKLTADGVPFIVSTGDRMNVSRFPDALILDKPYLAGDVSDAVVLATSRTAPRIGDGNTS